MDIRIILFDSMDKRGVNNMDQELRLEIIYENNLDTDKFARMFNNKAQSYKFYWFEAILNLSVASEEDLTFEEIIDEMICEAWHTVTHYHLRLGPTVNGNAENFLEHAFCYQKLGAIQQSAVLRTGTRVFRG